MGRLRETIEGIMYEEPAETPKGPSTLRSKIESALPSGGGISPADTRTPLTYEGTPGLPQSTDFDPRYAQQGDATGRRVMTPMGLRDRPPSVSELVGAGEATQSQEAEAEAAIPPERSQLSDEFTTDEASRGDVPNTGELSDPSEVSAQEQRNLDLGFGRSTTGELTQSEGPVRATGAGGDGFTATLTQQFVRPGLASEEAYQNQALQTQVDRDVAKQRVFQAAQTDYDIADILSNLGDMQAESGQEIQDSVRAGLAERQRMMGGLQREIDRVAARNIDPEHFFSSRSQGTRFGASIAVALGTLGQALAPGLPNVALQIIDNAIDRDLQAQVANSNRDLNLLGQRRNLYSDLVQLTNDDQAARIMFRELHYEEALTRMNSLRSRAHGNDQVAALNTAIAQVQLQLANARVEREEAMTRVSVATSQTIRGRRRSQRALQEIFDQYSNDVNERARSQEGAPPTEESATAPTAPPSGPSRTPRPRTPRAPAPSTPTPETAAEETPRPSARDEGVAGSGDTSPRRLPALDTSGDLWGVGVEVHGNGARGDYNAPFVREAIPQPLEDGTTMTLTPMVQNGHFIRDRQNRQLFRIQHDHRTANVNREEYAQANEPSELLPMGFEIASADSQRRWERLSTTRQDEIRGRMQGLARLQLALNRFQTIIDENRNGTFSPTVGAEARARTYQAFQGVREMYGLAQIVGHEETQVNDFLGGVSSADSVTRFVFDRAVRNLPALYDVLNDELSLVVDETGMTRRRGARQNSSQTRRELDAAGVTRPGR